MTGKVSNCHDPWRIDSGACNDITHHENLLNNTKNSVNCSSVTIPNGENVDVKKVKCSLV